MRIESQEINVYAGSQSNHSNIILQTRKMVKQMKQLERFQKALRHVNDALSFRVPQPDYYGPDLPFLFRFCYSIQVTNFWTWFLLSLTYVYVYLVLLDPKQNFVSKLVIEVIILTIYWLDILMYLYRKSFEVLRKSRLQRRFYIKLVVLIILVVDLIVFASTKAVDIRYFRPFRFVRGLLPIFYDSITRKNLYALFASYKDLLALLIFYFSMIIVFALMASQFIDLPQDYKHDPYIDNYNNFLICIFIIYGLGTYDYYPDSQLAGIIWSQWVYLFFLIFIFLNLLIFFTIPTSIIFQSFRETRSKSLILDQIRQQHSLILAFVTLGQQNFYIDGAILVRFLLYMYKYKLRYINYISQICLKMDQNSNGTVQINQFMQFCRILTKNSHMMPPRFHDIQLWIQFREFINKYLHLKQIVTNWNYKFITNLIIILAFMNSIAYLASLRRQLYILDIIFEALFVTDIALRFVGLGYEQFFRDKWNNIDLFLVTAILIFQIIPSQLIPKNIQVILKLFRIFRIVTLIKLLRTQTEKLSLNQNSIYSMIRKLISQTTIIIPTIVKYAPFYFLIYYYLGIFGMEIFHYAQMEPPHPKYGMYHQFAHFKDFLGSQIVMTQILTQAGWILLTFDYSLRTGGYYVPTALYTMFCHVWICLIMGSLMKALVWEAYTAVDCQFKQQKQAEIKANKQSCQSKFKKAQFAQIRQIIQQSGFIVPSTAVKRQFLQNKLDLQIFKRLRQLYVKKISQNKQECKTKRRSGVIQQIVLDKQKYLIEDSLQDESIAQGTQAVNKIYQNIIRQNLKNDKLQVAEQKDFDQEMEQMMEKIILHPKSKYSITIAYPKLLFQLLQQKMTRPFQKTVESSYNINKSLIRSQYAMQSHAYQLNVLLQIQKSEKTQTKQVLRQMGKLQIIKQDESKDSFQKKSFQSNSSIDSDWIIRNIFLKGASQQMIDKYQIQYFSDVYGRSFTQINKPTLEPLLKYQAFLEYNLKNIMRFSQVPSRHFFQIFTKVQDQISNHLLKKGSLFKFVYQFETFSDNWFTVEFSNLQQIKIHFIKTGIWMYDKRMKENEIYYGKDFFNCNFQDKPDNITCYTILKLLYQSFESLAYGLQKHTNFFNSNPSSFRYDVYSFYMDVNKVQRSTRRKLQLSKIMVIALVRQQQRTQKLIYQVSQISSQKQKIKKDLAFLANQQDEIFEKVTNLSTEQQQQIIESQGLPYGYVLNLMRQMKDVVNIHSKNLVNQVQKALNQQFDNN